eukprot:6210183-Pleurochrysis_carterae.AAC.1
MYIDETCAYASQPCYQSTGWPWPSRRVKHGQGLCLRWPHPLTKSRRCAQFHAGCVSAREVELAAGAAPFCALISLHGRSVLWASAWERARA